MTIQMMTGMIARRRVTRRRIQTGNFIWMKPSMTIWPVKVPVMVAFWPDASSATANRTLRTGLAMEPTMALFCKAS